MLETKEQKQVFAGSLVLIVILGVVSFWNRPGFKYVEPVKPANKNQSVQEAQAYLDYLKTIKTDPAASKKLFQTILTQDDVRKEVVTALKADQKPSPVVIDATKFKKTSASNGTTVNNYLSQTIGQILAFNSKTQSLNQELYGLSKESADQLKTSVNSLTAGLYKTPVPQEAVSMHQALLAAYGAYSNLIDTAKQYNSEDYQANDQLWPAMYAAYLNSNQSALNFSNELDKLTGKYKIAQIYVSSDLALGRNQLQTNALGIPTAQAFLGVGDVTITVGDIPRIVMDAVKSGIQSAFLQFMGSMLGKLIAQIEQNYMIANFLYYSDALVNGQYTQDYLNKYVTDTLDQQIVKKFIPQFTCGNQPQNLEPFFQAKAQTYLGFDPSNLDINDPQYYQKLARVGDFMASPSGWRQHYQDIAASTENAAQQAVSRELTSSGLKTPRDVSKVSITKSISSIVSAERASFNSLLNLGISNAESIISQVVAKLTQNLINQFVFAGVTGNVGGSVGVLKEQSLCTDVFQITPVVGITDTTYTQPGTVTQADAQAIQCSYSADIDAVCTQSIITFLNKCATNPSVETNTQCTGVATSAYVQAVMRSCVLTPNIPACAQIKSLSGQVSP